MQLISPLCITVQNSAILPGYSYLQGRLGKWVPGIFSLCCGRKVFPVGKKGRIMHIRQTTKVFQNHYLPKIHPACFSTRASSTGHPAPSHMTSDPVIPSKVWACSFCSFTHCWWDDHLGYGTPEPQNGVWLIAETPLEGLMAVFREFWFL